MDNEDITEIAGITKAEIKSRGRKKRPKAKDKKVRK